MAVGASHFVRFWANDPYTHAVTDNWRLYDVDQMARGYFIFNALEIAVGEAVKQNLWAWFPTDGKDIHFVTDAPLRP